MREATEPSQRKFAKRSGIHFSKVQAIEKGSRRIWLDDFDKWLRACGTSLHLYLIQHLDKEEIRIREKDRALMDSFVRALKIPRHRRALESLLAAFGVDEPSGKAPQ